MAKTNMLMREKKRLKIAKKFATRRAELKELIRDPKTGRGSSAKPRRSSCRSSRATRAPCGSATAARSPGRSRGVYRKFGLARTKLREAANRGEIPGLSKASW